MNEKSSEAYHESQLYRIRHSTAHLMAAAVLEMFPEGKIAIGPPIENGFYYDFDLPRALTPEDLAKIESRMRALIAERQRLRLPGDHPGGRPASSSPTSPTSWS